MKSRLLRVKLLLAIALLLSFSNSRAEEAISPESYVSAKAITFDNQTKDMRSTLNVKLEQVAGSDDLFKLAQKGAGDYDMYQNVSWIIESELQLREGILCPLFTKRTIRDLKGKMIAIHEQVYNYQKRNIYVTKQTPEGKKIQRALYPMKGRTCDYATMIYCLKTYLQYIDNPKFRSFYLLTPYPSLYRIQIKFLGYETLDLPIGKKEAKKFKLVTDMGFLNMFLETIFPPTYIWYEKESPHIWLQYEGLETTRDSKCVQTYLSQVDYCLDSAPQERTTPAEE